MKRWIGKAIREKQRQEFLDLFGRSVQRRVAARSKSHVEEELDLVRLLPQGGRLRATLKAKTYKALAKPDGRIRYNGSYYKSLSTAAYAALKRPTNGWWFWQVERSRGDWVRLTKVRKAGTAVYPR
jgi:hypothetical protein